MSFTNPIVAGDQLIRNAVRSENFDDGSVTGTPAGWSINRDGTATFTNVATSGSAIGTQATYDNIVANNSFIYKGIELQARLDALPKGIVAWGQTTNAPAPSAVEQAIQEITFFATAGRMYRIMHSPVSALVSGLAPRLYWTLDGSQPTVGGATTTLLGASISDINTTSDMAFISGGFTGQTVRVLLTALRLAAGGQASFPTGIVGWEVWAEDIGLQIPSTAINRITGVPQKQRFAFDILPTAARSYKGSGALFNSNSYAYQGQSPFAGNGNMRSYIWFDKATFLDSLIGVPVGDIESLEIFLHYEHWYNGSGGDAVIGRNNNPVVTNTENPLGAYDQIRSNFPGRNIGKWIDIKGVADFTTALFNGNMYGFILGPAPTSSLFYYGYTRAQNSGCALRSVFYK